MFSENLINLKQISSILRLKRTDENSIKFRMLTLKSYLFHRMFTMNKQFILQIHDMPACSADTSCVFVCLHYPYTTAVLLNVLFSSATPAISFAIAVSTFCCRYAACFLCTCMAPKEARYIGAATK